MRETTTTNLRRLDAVSYLSNLIWVLRSLIPEGLSEGWKLPEFPILRELNVWDTYDIADVSPLSDLTIPTLLELLKHAPHCAYVTLAIKKLPVLSSELYKTCTPESFPHAICAILQRTLEKIDRAMCEIDPRMLVLSFTLRSQVNTRSANAAREHLEMNYPKAVAKLMPPDKSVPPGDYPAFCSLMDQLNDYLDEFRNFFTHIQPDEALGTTDAFESFYLPKLYARRKQGLLNLFLVIENDLSREECDRDGNNNSNVPCVVGRY